MACRLKTALRTDQFRVFERQSGIGGTWWINRYPGVACDVPALLYSLSFYQNPYWSSFWPTGAEVLGYYHRVCERYRLIDKIQLNTDVKDCRWLESEQIWALTLQHLVPGAGDLSENDRAKQIKEQGLTAVVVGEEKIRCKILISAIGGLVEPKLLPDNIPGREDFEGPIFHSARWRSDVDLANKDVVVLGAGCSAAQVVPSLRNICGAKSVMQIMRSPPWVYPKPKNFYGNLSIEEWTLWLAKHVPGLNKLARLYLAASNEWQWRIFGSSKFAAMEREKYEARLLQHMKSTVPAKYHEILTPSQPVGCKRRLTDGPQGWFDSLSDPAIELTNLPLVKLSSKSVTLGAERTHPPPSNSTNPASNPGQETTIPADAIILANGFETHQWFHPLEVISRTGKTMQKVWDKRGGPQMYMGTALDGFPNFFTNFGPNTVTGHTSILITSENTVELVLKCIRPVLRGECTTVEVKRKAALEYTNDIQRQLQQTVFHFGGCSNWYINKEGYNSVTYPYACPILPPSS